MLQAMAGYDPTDQLADMPVPDYANALTDRLDGLTVGIARGFYRDDYDTPADIAGTYDVMEVFEGLGAKVSTPTYRC